MGGLIASVVLATSVLFGSWSPFPPPTCPKVLTFKWPVCTLVQHGAVYDLSCSIKTIRITIPCR